MISSGKDFADCWKESPELPHSFPVKICLPNYPRCRGICQADENVTYLSQQFPSTTFTVASLFQCFPNPISSRIIWHRGRRWDDAGGRLLSSIEICQETISESLTSATWQLDSVVLSTHIAVPRKVARSSSSWIIHETRDYQWHSQEENKPGCSGGILCQKK